MAPGTLADSTSHFPFPADRSTHSANGHMKTLNARDEDHEWEPIAIVGMGCRLPGGVDSPSKLWNLLIQGKSTQSPIPKSRFNIDGFYHPHMDRPGSMFTAGGYFLNEDIRAFDNDFFGINNLEAKYMDPEQRKLLEVVFECFESSGTILEKVSGANIGCYVGKFTYDYLTMQNRDPEYLHRYSATGMSTTILANRVSHIFNLQGPSVVLDTACSSSLYCLHMACNALNSGECDSAIVAGANLIQSPEQHIATMKAGVLSPTSTCHTFDKSADGYGRGESVGALYIKRLSKAIEDGDQIRSIIRGTAVNSNGKTQGITLPSAERQEEVIRKAYVRAGLSPDETNYVECHGTGTPVGDPIEIEALSRVFKRSNDLPLLVGSVKPSVGHSEAASAITSIIKVTLALEKGEIPATFGVKEVNPRINTDDGKVEVLTKNTPWPDQNPFHVRTASVNSFGFGGANAHAILQAANSDVDLICSDSGPAMAVAKATLLLPFSAKNQSSLESRIVDLEHVCRCGISITDLAHSLGVGRSRFEARGFVLASQESLQTDVQLQNLRTNKDHKDSSPQPLAFIFTGQGAQWPQMGLGLIQRSSKFRRTIQKLDSVLHNIPDPPSWNIQDILSEPCETSKIHHAAYSQTVCTAVQIALVQLLSEWGVQPDYVIGHSSGEICAAYTSNLISADEAILIAYYRGYACSMVSTPGAMLATGYSQHEATNAIKALGLQDHVQVACINSPENVTVSGDRDEITRLCDSLAALGVFARELRTDGKAYHSYHMATVGRGYEEMIAAATKPFSGTRRVACGPQWISTVTGELVETIIDHTYWRKNLESPVRFADAIQSVVERTGAHFVEIGPHSVLQLPIKQVLNALEIEQRNFAYFSTLLRGVSGPECLLNLMGQLWIHNHDVSFSSINNVDLPSSSLANDEKQGKIIVDLPTYKWKHDTPLWSESRYSYEFRNRKYPRHDILGSRLPGTGQAASIWRNILMVSNVPWLRDHRIDEQIVFAAAGYIAMAMEAACQLMDGDISSLPPCHLENIAISKAMVLSDEDSDRGVELYTTLHLLPSSSHENSRKMWQFSVASCIGDDTTTHADGTISIEAEQPSIREKLSVNNDGLEPQSTRSWYDRLSQVGLNFSGDFRCLTSIQNPIDQHSRRTLATTSLKCGGGMEAQSKYALHPSTIDGILHTGLIATAAGTLKDFRLRIPVYIESILIDIPAPFCGDEPLSIRAAATPTGVDTMIVSVEAQSEHNKTFIQVDNVRLSVPFQDQQLSSLERHPMLRVVWKPDITRIEAQDPNSFLAYLCSSAAFSSAPDKTAGFEDILAALDLLTHKNPGLRIANLQDVFADTDEEILKFLEFHTAFKRCQSFARATWSDKNMISEETATLASTGHYDFGKKTPATAASCDLMLQCQTGPDYPVGQIKRMLSPKGALLGHFSDVQATILENAQFSITYLTTSRPSALLLVRPPTDHDLEAKKLVIGVNNNSTGHDFVLIERNHNHELNDLLEAKLERYVGHGIVRIPFDKLGLQRVRPGSTVVSTIELEQPLLSSITDEDLRRIKTITDSASRLLWITGGGLLTGSRPDFAIVSGLSRAIMLEQPTVEFLCLDIDDTINQLAHTTENALFVLSQGLNEVTLDFEFIQHRGTLHVSRFAPEKTFNSNFRRKQGLEIVSQSLSQAKPCQLSFEKPRQSNSSFFRKMELKEGDLEADCVEIDVNTVDVDTHSANILLGRFETSNGMALLQLTGIITGIGKEVKSFAVGDHVVALAPGFIVSKARVPEWSCANLREDEYEGVYTPMLFACSTALYALHHCAKPSADDLILISPGASNIGIHAIQAMDPCSKTIFATTRTRQEEDFLINQLHMRKDQIFDLGDPCSAENMLAATNNQGFDFILGASNEALPPVVLDACADFCHIVETRQSSSNDVTPISNIMPSRGKSYTVFNLHELFSPTSGKNQRTWKHLMEASMEFCRNIEKLVMPVKSFDVGQISLALNHVGSGIPIGKATISLEDPDSAIRALPSKFDTIFDPNKTYFLIGCLGGLGRSISKWMCSRGARNFLFLSRSGLERRVAAELVSDLQSKGARVKVVRGDVCTLSDVENAVNTITTPLGGVIQAAMGLAESLFTAMTSQQWQTAMLPKVIGTWNVHNAVQGKESELDFFLMTSSISGSVGVATEANYCASNYFLDIFARYRRSKGLPAITVGLGMISQIGYLHEHPDIQAQLVNKGVSALDADDFLQIIDAALFSSPTETTEYDYDSLSQSHILTGLEPLGLNELRKRGFEGIPATFSDPRAVLLNDALGGADIKATTGSANGMPVAIADALKKGDSIFDTTLLLIAKQLSNFLLTPLDKLDTSKPLAVFGIDSMLAAAVRAWFYRKFQIDLPFMMLLSQTVSIRDLAQTVTDHVVKRMEAQGA